MSVFTSRKRLLIEGIMPERTLLRLKRAGISVYRVKKTQKNQILLSVKKKDCEKVFAIYPKVCYNRTVRSAYVVREAGAEGWGKYFDRAKSRIGFLLGALLFCAGTLYADGFVFGVDCAGTEVYRRETLAALEEYGIAPFSRYRSGKEDLVCAKLLSLDGVEFCSVKKTGLTVTVEVRLSPFASRTEHKGDMQTKHAGKLLSLTVLRGTPLKKAGDEVSAGEPLVGGYFLTQSGERKAVSPIARASVACTYEEEIAADSAEEAFAKAYLNVGFTANDALTEKRIEEKDGTFHVKLYYTAIETVNL